MSQEVCPGVHRIEAPLGERFVAVHLIVGSRSCLVVDTGIAPTARSHLLPCLDRLGVAPDSLRHVVSTHSDFDHIGGNAAVARWAPHAEVMCHDLDRPLVDDLEALIHRRYGEFREADGFDETDESKAWIRSVTEVSPVHRTLSGGERIDLGDRTVEIVHVPGHSPGHLAVHDLESDALCIGDAALFDSVLTARGEPAFPPTYRDVGPYLETIEKLAARAPAVMLPAHYPVRTGVEVGEFLDTSRNYVGRVDEEVVDALRRAGGPVTTLELLRSIAARLGSWPGDAADFLIYPVAGHLDRLHERGRVATGTCGGRRTWKWVQGR